MSAYVKNGVGVFIFFVLSGFLITRILVNEFDRTGKLDFRNFYARRFLRLMPALWVLLAIYITASIVRGGPHERACLLSAASAFAYFMNWTRAFKLGPEGALGHTWSLSVEEQFYIIMPFLLLILLRLFRRGSVWKILALMALTSASWRLSLALSGASLARIYNGLDTEAESLLIGGAIAIAPAGHMVPFLNKFRLIPVLCLTAVAIFASWDQLVQTLCWSVISLCTAWLIIVIMETGAKKPFPMMSWLPLVYLGRISYGVYLWHAPIGIWVGRHLSSSSCVVDFAVTLGLAFGIAAISSHTIESPMLKLKVHLSADRPRARATYQNLDSGRVVTNPAVIGR
jgi:peptidoglycan/LPS O-acetylase OafA/YrhL